MKLGLYSLYEKGKSSKNTLVISFFMFFSFLVLFFCTKSSPFFPTNDWPDTATYFTMGKSMFRGRILYKEIFDNKGPLFYFMNGLASLISERGYFGVYIFQSVSFFVVLLYTYKTASLFVTKTKAVFTAIAIPFFIFNSHIYISGGGSPEEFILAFQSVSFFYFIRYFKDPDNAEHDPRVMFLHGIMVSCVLMFKYTPVSFWAGFLFFIYLRILLKGCFKNFLKNAAAFLVGILIVVLPWLIYFVLTNSLKDFYETYFVYNSAYANLSLSLNTVKAFLNTLIKVNKLNYGCFLLFVIGLGYMISSKSRLGLLGKLALISSMGITFAVVYFSGISFSYYFLPVSIFIVPGLIAVCSALVKDDINKKVLLLFAALVLILTVKVNGLYAGYSRIYAKPDPVQETFTNIIKQEKDPTLIYLLTQDYGLYTAGGIVPSERFFYLPFVRYSKYPYIVDSQYEYIKNKRVKFVATRTPTVLSVQGGTAELEKRVFDELERNYTLVATQRQYNIAGWFQYKLYKVKTSP